MGNRQFEVRVDGGESLVIRWKIKTPKWITPVFTRIKTEKGERGKRKRLRDVSVRGPNDPVGTSRST